MNIEVRQDFIHFKIYINDVIHVSLLVEELIGFISRMHSEYYYTIMFVTKTNNAVTEYDNKEKWITVLKELDKEF